MQSFNIIRKSQPSDSFRVASIKSDFDVRDEHSQEHFEGTIQMPDDWNIGVIWGGSGTGKSTIAKELYPSELITGFEYTGASVVDDMPKNCTVSEIEKMFYTVGFGSVPSWLKPYNVLSNGEKMRVDLARALLEREFIVFDEFTSVVDRNVAKTACIAISKAIHKLGKRFIAVTCHSDILEWLQPDWQFCTDTMSGSFTNPHDRKRISASEVVGSTSGASLGSIII